MRVRDFVAEEELAADRRHVAHDTPLTLPSHAAESPMARRESAPMPAMSAPRGKVGVGFCMVGS